MIEYVSVYLFLFVVTAFLFVSIMSWKLANQCEFYRHKLALNTYKHNVDKALEDMQNTEKKLVKERSE